MFSRGNIKEKRVLDWFKNLDQTIVLIFIVGLDIFLYLILKWR